MPFGHSVRLVDFLETLTGLKEQDLDLGSINKQNKSQLLSQGRLFWNHFISISYIPTSEKSLYRGLAVQCRRSEPEEIDQIFPIYLQSDPKARPDEKCISICAVQFTNQDPDETLFLEDEDCEWSPSLAGIELLEPNPYLVLGFSLQRSRQKSHTSGSKRCSTENDDRRASLTFNSIGSFPFLTPRLVAALEELSEAYVDLLALHREAGTKEYLLNVSPRVYAR
ncbi:hypothetical protein PTTG_25477 [Puccinia triticina 1-1 BBBD Race 1]|uniref:Uncharacterized protein n=1 Tax=Puccinia triticina (isolate 1-1 / race 1 (BBBD)) TaxID=630390 RepID=A0A180H305_PUCT1|nr:hypothetical protein PTTG_25477 [Puccinia triticina 1-1 BBBD Race 1]